MTDQTTTIDDLKKKMGDFIDQRRWSQFHNPKNLSMALSIEAGELMEYFIWAQSEESKGVLEKRRKEIEHEVADIAAYLLSFCHQNKIDLAHAFEEKMKLNAEKYPVNKSKGSWAKYSDL